MLGAAVASIADPDKREPENRIDRAALDRQMEQLTGIKRLQDTPTPLTVDYASFQAEAAAAAVADIYKISDVALGVMRGLDAVDVDLLQADRFRFPLGKVGSARQSDDAITRARAYLDPAIKEGPAAAERTRAYADAISRAWEEKEESQRAAFESQAQPMIVDTAAKQAELQ
jgi:hypothetical protein